MLNQGPLISVLMTCYNREKYIAEAIESVLASSYKNFELIIVDDRSADASVQIIQQYAGKDARVKLYVNDTNLGDYPNRNRAASYAAGKYLKYVDSDDLIYPWGLELVVLQMEANPAAGYGLCSLPQDIEKPYPILLNPEAAYRYNYNVQAIFQKAPLSSVIRRDVFEKENGFLPERMSSDFEMWHRLSQKYNVLLMADGIVWGRAHEGREMNDSSAFVRSYAGITKKYLTHPACPLSPAEVQAVFKNIRRSVQKKLIKDIITGRFKNASENLLRLRVFKDQ